MFKTLAFCRRCCKSNKTVWMLSDEACCTLPFSSFPSLPYPVFLFSLYFSPSFAPPPPPVPFPSSIYPFLPPSGNSQLFCLCTISQTIKITLRCFSRSLLVLYESKNNYKKGATSNFFAIFVTFASLLTRGDANAEIISEDTSGSSHALSTQMSPSAVSL